MDSPCMRDGEGFTFRCSYSHSQDEIRAGAVTVIDSGSGTVEVRREESRKQKAKKREEAVLVLAYGHKICSKRLEF